MLEQVLSRDQFSHTVLVRRSGLAKPWIVGHFLDYSPDKLYDETSCDSLREAVLLQNLIRKRIIDRVARDAEALKELTTDRIV